MTPNRHVEIAKRAHAIWELEGRPSGRDLDHWLRAEAEFDATQRAQIAKEGPAKPPRPRAKRDRRTK
ncbi:MAG: DUF2934 domain-containing protein [Xanthobacteraceae bacterium]